MSPADLPEDLLSAYLDNELNADTRAAVEAQLATAPAWQSILADVEAARTMVRALPPVELDPAAWPRIVAAVRTDESVATTVPPPPSRLAAVRGELRRHSGRWGGVAAVAAAAALIAALVVPAQHHITPKVATFSNEQTARASVAGDPVSALAGVGLMRGVGR